MVKRLLVPVIIMLALLAFGGVFIVLFANATVVNCTRQDDRQYACQIQTLLFGRYLTSERSVDGIRDIVIVESCDEDGCTYRAEFVGADREQFPLTSVWTDIGPVRKQVEAIRTQMLSGEQTITYTAPTMWWVVWLIVALTLVFPLFSLVAWLRSGR